MADYPAIGAIVAILSFILFIVYLFYAGGAKDIQRGNL